MPNQDEISRRGFLSMSSGLAASSILSSSVSKRSQGNSDYHIGLPIRKEWDTQLNTRVDVGSIQRESIFVSTGDGDFETSGSIYEVEIQSGKQVWEYSTDKSASPPIVSDGIAYFLDGNDLKAVRTGTSTPQWILRTNYDITTYWIPVSDNLIVFNGANIESDVGESGPEISRGDIIGVDKRGNQQFNVSSSYAPSIQIDDSTLYYLDNTWDITENQNLQLRQSSLISFDTNKQNQRWRQDQVSSARFHLTDSSIITTEMNGNGISAYKKSDGSPKWDIELIGEATDITHNADQIFLVVGSHIVCLDRKTRKELWRRQLVDVFDITWYEDILFAGTTSGKIQALDPGDGTVVWEANVDGNGHGYERAYEGYLFYVTEGQLTAFSGQRARVPRKFEQFQNSTLYDATNPVGEYTGTSQLVNGAKQAIDDENYRRANLLLRRAEKRAEYTAAGFLASGGFVTYTGARVGAQRIEKAQLNSVISTVESKYPIEVGVLAGVEPDQYLVKARNIRDEKRGTFVGVPLRNYHKSDKREFIKGLRTLEQLYSELKETSSWLDKLPESSSTRLTATNRLQEHISKGAHDELDQVLSVKDRNRELIDSWLELSSESIVIDGKVLDIERLDDHLEKLFNFDITEERRGQIENFCRESIWAFKTAINSREQLAEYDLSNICSKLNDAISIDLDSPPTAVARIQNIREILEIAVDIKTETQSLVLEYSEYSMETIAERTQSCLDDVAISDIHEVKRLVTDLQEAKWKISDLYELSESEIENLVRYMYESEGFEISTLNQEVDSRIKFIAIKDDSRVAVCIQNLQERNKLAAAIVQQIVGDLSELDAGKAVIISLAGFTREAKESANKYAGHTQLMDSKNFVQAIARRGIVPPELEGPDESGGQLVCSSCGNEYDRGTQFCRHCGAELNSD